MGDCCCCPTWLLLIVGFYGAVKLYNYLTTGIYTGKEKLDGKTIIVTGSNSGIGVVTAKDFARRGARLIMVCRDMNKAEKVKSEIISETNNTNISLKHIDFGSFESVRKCANEILAEESRIDVLVNNAGALGIGFGQTKDGFEKLMQANHFGPFLFTNILLGKIKQSAPSRIVNVSSLAYKTGNIDLNYMKKTNRTSEMPLYCDTKLANIYFTNELARKLEGTGVTSNSLHPGSILTDILRDVNVVIKVVWGTILRVFFKTVEEGAQTSIYLSVSPEVAQVTGEYFSDCKIQKLTEKARDMGMAKKLWDYSEDAVGLKPNEKHY